MLLKQSLDLVFMGSSLFWCVLLLNGILDNPRGLQKTAVYHAVVYSRNSLSRAEEA
jgi:hypothetical protein